MENSHHPAKAKTNSPSQNADFRPIFILPVLSRIVEKQIVQRFIYPTLTQAPLESLVSDQFAFRPTGSTSAAIISIIHHTQILLKTNEYVSIISLDFSKAFGLRSKPRSQNSDRQNRDHKIAMHKTATA